MNIDDRVRMSGDLGDAVATGSVVGFRSTVDLEGVDSASTFVRFDDGEVIGCHRDDIEPVDLRYEFRSALGGWAAESAVVPGETLEHCRDWLWVYAEGPGFSVMVRWSEVPA